MNMILKHSIDRIVEKGEQDTIVPIGTISINFDGLGVFTLSGDLISIFDSMLSESIRVILQSLTTGRVYSIEAAGALTLEIAKDGLLEINIFENHSRLNQRNSSGTFLIKPIVWLSKIADEFRVFQEFPGVSRETVLRQSRGKTISLLEVLI